MKRTAVPRLLVVVTLPNEPEEWLSFSPEQLVLKRCAYWLNLFGRSPTQNKSGETVQLLRAQTFDPGTLSDLMRKAARQELQR